MVGVRTAPERTVNRCSCRHPSNIADLRTSDPPAAREIQLHASEQFTEYFGKGLAVVGFERSPDAGTYLLAPWHSP